MPTDEELATVGVTGIFLGYYLPWDGYSNALIAQAHGFSTLNTTVEGSLVIMRIWTIIKLEYMIISSF